MEIPVNWMYFLGGCAFLFVSMIVYELLKEVNKSKWKLKKDQKDYGVRRVKDCFLFIVVIVLAFVANQLFFNGQAAADTFQVLGSGAILILLVICTRFFNTYEAQIISMLAIVFIYVGNTNGLILTEFFMHAILFKWLIEFSTGIKITFKFSDYSWINKNIKKEIKKQK